MHLTAGVIALIAGASLLAGGINAVAGGGTLLSFPALLLAGYAPITANVSNTLGLLPGYAGGSTAYRRELAGQGARVRLLTVAGGLGAVAGALLLVHTSQNVFAGVVPWLILVSSLLLALQPLAAGLSRRATTRARRYALVAGGAAAGVYGGFFGAGLGVVMLALLGLFLPDDLQRLNALKGVVSLAINIVAAIVFLFAGPIAWEAVAIMLPASIVGGFAGVLVARRINATMLRVLVVAFGLAVAVKLLV